MHPAGRLYFTALLRRLTSTWRRRIGSTQIGVSLPITGGRSVTLWVDTGFTADMEITDVAFGSEAYFDLLTTPGMAEWLAVGPQVVVVTGPGTAVRVTLTQE